MSAVRRSLMNGNAEEGGLYAVTKKNNAPVMAICYAQGWAANENYMTFEEAAAVTNIGTVFAVNTVTSFNEFQYFTGVTAIPNNAFNNSGSKLSSIILPPNITSIGTLAFRFCKLTEFTITPSITTINRNSLQDCSLLTKFVFDNNNTSVANVNWIINTPCDTIEIGDNCTAFNVYNNCLYSFDYSKLYRCAPIRSSITFHSSITSFADNALTNVRLISLTIPNGVTSLPNGFASGSYLTSVNLNNVTTFVTGYCFESARLTSIDLSNIIGNLQFTTFRYCPLTFIKIGSGVNNMNNAFLNCTNVATIVVEATTPPATTDQSFTNIAATAATNNLHVYVPDASVTTYKTTGKWADIASYIYPLSEYVSS